MTEASDLNSSPNKRRRAASSNPWPWAKDTRLSVPVSVLGTTGVISCMRPSVIQVLFRASPCSGVVATMELTASPTPLNKVGGLVALATGLRLGMVCAGFVLGKPAADAKVGVAVGIHAGTNISRVRLSAGWGTSSKASAESKVSVVARVCPGMPWGAGGDSWAKTEAKPDSRVSSLDSASPKSPGSLGLTGALGCKTVKTSSVMCVTGHPVVRTTASASVIPLSKKHDRQVFAVSLGTVESCGTGIA